MEEINIEERPKEINIDDIEILNNKCQLNAKQIANKYPDTQYIEGILLIIDKENRAKALPHAWNKLNDSHFDITEMNWIGKDFDEIVQTKYLFLKSYLGIELNNNELKFSEKTIITAREMNDQLKDNEE